MADAVFDEIGQGIEVLDDGVSVATSVSALDFTGGSSAASDAGGGKVTVPIGGGSGDFANGGDTAGADRTLGNNDNFDLAFETNNTQRMRLSNDGTVLIGTAASHVATFFVQGGVGFDDTIVTAAAYTVDSGANDDTFLSVNRAGAVTITLPDANAAGQGRLLVIKDIGGNAGTAGQEITVDAAGTDLIDGAATAVISSAYGSVTIYCDGSANWYII